MQIDAMNKIREKVLAEKPESGARQIGEVVLMIAAASDQAAQIIAADLDNEAMSLDKCFAALRDYARKHQQGGFWGCMCNSFDKANPVVQVICDFYKIPAEAFAEKTETQAFGQPQAAPVVDLLDLL